MKHNKSKIIKILKKSVYNVNVQYEDWLKSKALSISQPYIDGKNYMSNISKQSFLPSDVSRRKDMVILKILDEKTYTFDNALFIINPFSVSPLTGLLIFNTEEPCTVRYTIKGMRCSADYTNCDKNFTTKHQVPIVGMYDFAINTIHVCLEDEAGNVTDSTTIRIKLPRVGKTLRKCLSINKGQKKLPGDFALATGGYSGTNYAFDENANIRWYLTSPVHPYGIHFLNNGHFLVPDKRMRRPNYGNAHSVVAYEMDCLGRVYNNLYHRSGFHHWAASKGNSGNILIGTSSRYDTYMENSIDELDKDTGKVAFSLNINDLFDKTYVTRYDWAHVNSFEYIPEEDAIIASYRNIHTIAKFKMSTKEIEWILANPEFYRGTAQEEKVLVPDKNVEWFFQQHGLKLLESTNTRNEKRIRIAIFDNHTANRRPVDYFDDVQNSYIATYAIDEIAHTVSMEKRIQTPLSITRSNVEYYEDSRQIYAMCANIKDDSVSYRAKILGFDYDSGECVYDVSCTNDFFIAKFINFDLSAVKNSVHEHKDLCLGELFPPSMEKALPDEHKDAPLFPEEMKKEAQFSIWGNVLQIYCKDHSVQNIWLYSDDYTYVMNFDDTEQLTKIFSEHTYCISVPLSSLEKGRYHISMKYEGSLYKTHYWIEIQ